jgi:hypothetical protein
MPMKVKKLDDFNVGNLKILEVMRNISQFNNEKNNGAFTVSLIFCGVTSIV